MHPDPSDHANDLERAVRAALGDGDGAAQLLEGWPASWVSLPDDLPFYLHAPYIEQAGADANLDPALTAALVAAAAAVGADPRARALSWHVYRRVFHDPRFRWGVPDRWPFPTALVGEHASLFYLLALLGGLPMVRALHQAHAIPREVSRTTLNDMQRWASHVRARNGVWGLNPRQLAWLSLHMHGRLYHLGRLQYEMGDWHLPARVFRHTTSGRVVALSEQGVRYRADGQCDGAGGVDDPRGAWTARLELGPSAIAGHRILPSGRAERAATRLSRAAWTQVLAPGDNVLHLHIPRGAPLDVEACGHSLREAVSFFPTHFPEWSFVAFSCNSWLLDPQLEEWLVPTSNLVRFQRQMYLLPVRGDGTSPFYFIFDGVPSDLRQAPRDTALQRALLDHVLAGGHWRGGGCFLLPEDLPAWGSEVYRKDEQSAVVFA